MDRELLLIRMLLVMGCVERNPGPPVKEFTFRYQYLLIDVGTQVIRKIFDGRAVPDLKNFLTNNAKLQVLIKKKIITPAQEKLLPPKEPNPSSEHFDITLLCSLLRNICGLRPPGDNVWSQPASTDKSLEAYITRFRLCRNNVSHSESVLEDQTILKDKWTELCEILTKLGKFCNFQDLQTLITTAESIEIDEHLKARFETALKIWDEMETMFDRRQGEIIEILRTIRQGQEEIVAKLGEIYNEKKQSNQSKRQRVGDTSETEIDNEIKQSNQPKRQRVDDTSETEIDNENKQLNQSKDCQRVDDTSETEAVRQKLIDIYQKQFGFIQLCPLVEFEKGKIFKFYQVPEMEVVDYHQIVKQQTEQSRSEHMMEWEDQSDSEPELIKCEEIFCKGDKECKNIYLTADAGLGKTTFSRVMAFLWCNSKIGNQIENGKLQEYADYLARFEFVFHINLRDTEVVNVVSMIRNQLKPYLSDDKYDNLYEIIEKILGKHESLVILDGLDEWAPKQIDKQKFGLPIRPESSKCVYLTLCRPYKIENVRLSRLDIDHQINMIGFNVKAIEFYVAALVNYINTINDENKDPKKFLDEVENVGLSFLLHIPMITSQLVMLWLDRPITSMSRSMIYGNIIDLLFKIAHGREIDIPAQTNFNLPLPDALSNLSYLQTNFSLVRKLCLLSYRLLFEHDINITSLVFTREQLATEPYNLTEEETNLFCKIGIISKSQVYRKFGKQELKVSFLHKSYLEFLAAVYVSTLETSQVLDLFKTCTTIEDVLKFETFLILYAGLSPDGINSLISRIYSLVSDDLTSVRNKTTSIRPESIFCRLVIKRFMNMVLTCYIEGSCRVENPILLEDLVFGPYTKGRIMKLKQLLLLNGKNVKFLYASFDRYLDEFDKITNLQCLKITASESNFHKPGFYDVKLNELMLRNKSSLHTLCIGEDFIFISPQMVISDLPINSLQHLTSLALSRLNLSHQCLQSAVKFLSNNILLKSIRIKSVICNEHEIHSSDCTISCDFSDCNKLEMLQLEDTNILCSKVNVSSLKEISMAPSSQNVVSCYKGIFDCLQHALSLSFLKWNGNGLMHSDTVKYLISCIQFLPSLKSLDLGYIEIPANIHLILHPDVTKLDITLQYVTLSDTFFKSLIKEITKVQNCHLLNCLITQADGENLYKMSREKSCALMHDYLQTISNVNIRTSKWMIETSYNLQFAVINGQ